MLRLQELEDAAEWSHVVFPGTPSHMEGFESEFQSSHTSLSKLQANAASWYQAVLGHEGQRLWLGAYVSKVSRFWESFSTQPSLALASS